MYIIFNSKMFGVCRKIMYNTCRKVADNLDYFCVTLLNSQSEVKHMKLLLGCECSGTFTDAFIEAGVDAWSCDLNTCFGNHPEKHIQGDLLDVLAIGEFDALIAFPPCTHLSLAGVWMFPQKSKDGRMRSAYEFFMTLWNWPNLKYLCLENPLGVISNQKLLDTWIPGSKSLKYSQIVSWDDFGALYKKRTCLWLKNLPLLLPTSSRAGISYVDRLLGAGDFRRSITSPYFARAAAAQWSEFFRYDDVYPMTEVSEGYPWTL